MALGTRRARRGREVECEPAAVVVEFDPVALHGAHRAGEIPAAVDRMAQAHLSLMAGEAGEIGRFFQPAVQPRRGNLQAVILDPLDFEYPLQLPAHDSQSARVTPARSGTKFMFFLNKHA